MEKLLGLMQYTDCYDTDLEDESYHNIYENWLNFVTSSRYFSHEDTAMYTGEKIYTQTIFGELLLGNAA